MYKSKLSTFFEILTGFRQGCLLTSFPFLLAIDWIMKNCEGKDEIQWCPFEKLNTLHLQQSEKNKCKEGLK